MESVMTISISKKLGQMHKPRGIRNAASRIRFLVARSAKVGMDSVSIDPEVNNYLLSTVIKNRSKIKLSVSKSGDIVKVGLHGVKPAVKKQEQQKPQQKPAAKPAESSPKKDQAKPPKAPAETAKPAAADVKPQDAKPKPAAEKKQKKSPKENKEGKKE